MTLSAQNLVDNQGYDMFRGHTYLAAFLLLVIAFLAFFVLVMLHEANVVGRTAAPIWQWVGFFISLIWVYAHSIILHKMDESP